MSRLVALRTYEDEALWDDGCGCVWVGVGGIYLVTGGKQEETINSGLQAGRSLMPPSRGGRYTASAAVPDVTPSPTPFDALDVIFAELSALAPRLQAVTGALRARDADLERQIQNLQEQSASKDARIAQLEELVAEANARDTRSKMIHEEFEKRLSDESQRWAERHAALISGMVGSTPPPGISSQNATMVGGTKGATGTPNGRKGSGHTSASNSLTKKQSQDPTSSHMLIAQNVATASLTPEATSFSAGRPPSKPGTDHAGMATTLVFEKASASLPISSTAALIPANSTSPATAGRGRTASQSKAPPVRETLLGPVATPRQRALPASTPGAVTPVTPRSTGLRSGPLALALQPTVRVPADAAPTATPSTNPSTPAPGTPGRPRR